MSEFYEKDVALQQETLHDVESKHTPHEDSSHHTSLTEEEKAIEKQLVKKIDLLVMPLVLVVYLLNYIDRNNYAAAAIQGMPADLGMTDAQYQLGLSILFVGYVSMQVPSNAMLNYCGKPGWYIGFFTIAWGLVSALTSQVQSFGSMLACRLLLGIVEAPFFPGMLFYLSKWYTKSELNLRMSIFYSGSLISGAFGSLIAAGILDGLDNARGIAAWRWLYIVEGAITVAVGIVVVFVLPDFPDTWTGLSPEMMLVANRRMALDAGEADVNTGGKMSQLEGLKQAFLDPKTYILAIAYHGVVGAAGFQNFYPSIVQTLGFERVITLLLVAPPYVFTAFYSLAHGLASDKFQNRFWFFMYPVPLVIVGALIFMFTEGLGPRYFSLFLLNMIFVMNGTVYAWIANSIPRPPAKRAAALAFINSVGNAASIWTPFTYSGSQAPQYLQAMGINIGLVGIAGILGVTMYFYLNMQNKQLARMENVDTPLTDRDMKKLQKTAELEGIDVQTARMLQKGFRYIV